MDGAASRTSALPSHAHRVPGDEPGTRSAARWALLVSAIAVLLGAAPAAAAAAVRTGSIDDPPDVAVGLDIAAVRAEYADEGAIALRVRFHRPLDADEDAVVDLAVTSGDAGSACGDTRDGVAGLVDVALEDAELTFSQTGEDGTTVQHELPATATLSSDRLELDVEGRAAVLAARDLQCVQLATTSGDEVAAFPLVPLGGAEGPDTPAPGGPAGGSRLTISTPFLTLRRRGRVVTAAVRPTVCVRVGTRLSMVVVEVRGRAGVPSGGRRRLHRFVRVQRRPCQAHRMAWTFRVRSALRHRVVVSVVVSPG